MDNKNNICLIVYQKLKNSFLINTVVLIVICIFTM